MKLRCVSNRWKLLQYWTYSVWANKTTGQKIKRNLGILYRTFCTSVLLWTYTDMLGRSLSRFCLASLVYKWAANLSKDITRSPSNIHTYIIGHYNSSVWIIDLVSHLAYVVCVNFFIHKWQDLQFKVDSERQIFWETFHGNFISFAEFLPEICWDEIAEEIFFVFRFDVWPGTRTLAFGLISQHTTF